MRNSGLVAIGADGNRIVYDRFGESAGDPILLIHGGGQTRHSWRRVADGLVAAGHAVIAPDLRGHGDSDRAPDGVYRYERLVADLAAVIAQEGGQATIVGASLGGKIGLAAASALGPPRVCRLVLIDAVPRSSEGGIRRVAAVLHATDGFASPQEAAETIARSRGETVGPDAGARMARNLRQRGGGRWYWHYDPRFFDPAQELGVVPALDYLEGSARRVQVPTLLVRGELSDVVDAAGAEALAALIPHMDRAIIADAGHLIATERPDALLARLLPFLARTLQPVPLNSAT